MDKVLIIVPARSGSRGLKNKNRKLFLGKPLYYWPLKAAIDSKIANTIVLSTDDIKIIKEAKIFKDKILVIKRPKKYAKDNSSAYSYISHTLLELNKLKLSFKYLFLLEPTSPLTDIEDIKAVFRVLKSKNTSSVVSVQQNIKYHPFFNLKLLKSKYLKSLYSKKNIRRQQISKIFYLDGSIYASKISSFIKYKSFVQNKTKPYFTSPHKYIEIDDMFDFQLAEIIKKYYVEKNK